MEDDPPQTGTLPGAATSFPYMPTSGAIRALVVFVKAGPDNGEQCVDLFEYASTNGTGDSNPPYDSTTCGSGLPRYESPSDDPLTEWPARINGVSRMPGWASRFIDAPGTAPSNYQRGSLSQFFWQMSRGALKYEGVIYPELIVVPQQDLSESNLREAARHVIAHINQNPHADVIDYAQFDRYNNIAGRFGPDADGDGQPDLNPDGVFDQLILVGRSALANAAITYATQGWNEQIQGLSVRAGHKGRRGSGSWETGYTLDRAVAITAHEVGHTMLSDHTCSDADDPQLASKAEHNSLSLMCGPRTRSMSVSDRVTLGWITPRSVSASALPASLFTVDADPMAGDALWIHGPDGSAASPAMGDVLVEARTFASPWDGPPDFSDGDHADIALVPHEGLLVYKYRGPSPSVNPTYAYSSMDNTGGVGRRSFTSSSIERAFVRGVDPPHLGFTTGDAFTPLSRYLFEFYPSPLDGTLGVYDIAPAATSVSFRASNDFLTASTLRTLRTNYTLGYFGVRPDTARFGQGATPQFDRNRARKDHWTFGGPLTFAGGLSRIYGGSPEIDLLPETHLAFSAGGVTLEGPDGYTLPVRAGRDARVSFYSGFGVRRVAFSAADPRLGWYGIYAGPDPLVRERGTFRPTTPPTFARTTISGVRQNALVASTLLPGSALEVRGRTVLLTDRTEILNDLDNSGDTPTNDANGILATGSDTSVILERLVL